MKRMACVIALAAGSGMALGTAATPAHAGLIASAASGLQITVANSGNFSGDLVPLDVRFNGGSLRSIELYVDGALVKRQSLRTSRDNGRVTFSLEGLVEGAHDVLIKATDAQGGTATATARIRVTPEETGGPARFAFPKRNQQVKEIVPIELKIDASVRNPYVTYLLDNEFLALINLPPYTYNWDSSRVSNGTHTITVEVYDSENLALVKKLEMPVMVNNPGGFTERQKSPEAAKPEAAGNNVAKTVRNAAEASAPVTPDEFSSRDGGLLRAPGTAGYRPVNREASAPRTRFNSTSLPNVVNTARTVRPEVPNVRTGSLASPDVRPIAPTNTGIDVLRAARPSLMGLLSNPRDLTAFPVAGQTSLLARQAVRAARPGNIAARPSMTFVASTAPQKTVATVAPQMVYTPKPNAKPVVMAAAQRDPKVKTFQVAFDNTPIAFDVAPRVERGLPLAPFRQIFEHTGGQVKFFGGSKTVLAFNAKYEVEFKVGSGEAKVNNVSLPIERAPYIERGRAIVPLSFIRDALNVKVNYDAGTGRMVIESNK